MDVEEEEIPNEFECSLCLKLMLDPVSVSCGHTFCRQCINRSQEYRTACPMCRKPVHMGGGVNVLLANIIAERFPKTLTERQQERAGELTSVDSRPVATLPIVPVSDTLVPGSRRSVEFDDQYIPAYHAAVAGGHTLLCRGPIISTVCTIEHLAHKHAEVKSLYRCRVDNETATDGGFALGHAVECPDDPVPGEDLTNEDSTLFAVWEEAVLHINRFLSTMGDSGRAAFFSYHGRIPTLQRGDCSAASVIAASWWLCGVVRGPEERHLTTNTRARIEASTRILRESANKHIPPFNMPGGTPWALGGSQSLVLLLVIILVVIVKYCGIFDRQKM